MEEYKKPTFVWGLEGATVIKGSCRSDGSVNLVTLMAHIPKDTLIEFGGHELAGGFAVTHESVHFLEDHLVASYTEIKKVSSENTEDTRADMKLTLDDVNMKNYKDIAKLAPFGVGNPKPTFLFEHVMIQNVKEFGKEQNHLELCFENSNGRPVKAIAFFKTRASYPVHILEKGVSINLLASFELSNFAGREELRLRIVDIL
jgi:single-stranded-DNA-specific exonuclease